MKYQYLLEQPHMLLQCYRESEKLGLLIWRIMLDSSYLELKGKLGLEAKCVTI